MSERKNSPFKRKVLNYVANIVCYNHSGGKKKLLFLLVCFLFCFEFHIFRNVMSQ